MLDKSKMILACVGVITFSIIIFLLMILTGSDVAPQPITEPPVSARYQLAHTQSVTLSVRSQGEFKARTQTEFVSEVSGNVVWLNDSLIAGGQFQSGEVLARIDDRDYKTALSSASNAYSRADSELKLATSEYKRVSKLLSAKLVSQASYDGARRSLEVANAAVQDAKSQLAKVKRDLAKTELKAPFTGVVRNKSVDLGQFVNRGQIVASLFADDAIEVRLPIPDSQVNYLNIPLGSTANDGVISGNVRFTAQFAGQLNEWQGTLLRTEAEIDAKTRMITAVVGVDPKANSNGLPPILGLFVAAEIAGKTVENAVLLPRGALTEDGRVLIINDDDTLSFRSIDLVRIQDNQLVITGGISANERVVTSPIQTVVDGMRVSPYRVGE